MSSIGRSGLPMHVIPERSIEGIDRTIEAEIDMVLDFIPFVSTVSNIAAIIFKMIMSCCNPTWKHKSYFKHLQDKSYAKCLFFILPGINFVMAVFLHDREIAKVKLENAQLASEVAQTASKIAQVKLENAQFLSEIAQLKLDNAQNASGIAQLASEVAQTASELASIR